MTSDEWERACKERREIGDRIWDERKWRAYWNAEDFGPYRPMPRVYWGAAPDAAWRIPMHVSRNTSVAPASSEQEHWAAYDREHE